jgi:Domain of unknown function (DUF4276)
MVLLAVEDDLSESVARKLFCDAGYNDADIRCLAKRGFGHLQTKLKELLSTASAFTVLLLVDLDNRRCAPSLIADWMGRKIAPPRFMFRVAVREIEAWLLADRDTFADFLGVSKSRIARDTESIGDPKRYLLELASGGKRSIRSGLIPDRAAAASQGPEYNDLLCQFVVQKWSSERAASNNASLRRAVAAISKCRPANVAK